MSCVMIILNYNDSRRAWSLAQKCNSFKNINRIVIVDNNSTDDSVKFLKKNNQLDKIDIVFSNENKGFASGNNLGAWYAREKYNPDYLFFANTDTIFQENDVESCIKKISDDKKLALVSMRMKHISGKEERSAWKFLPFYKYLLLNFWIYRHFNYTEDTYKKFNEEFQYVDVVRGSFMVFQSKAFFEVGCFDENTFLYYEEDIISYRLKEANYKIGLLTNHFYVHNHIYTREKSDFFAKHYSDTSQKYFLNKYYKINNFEKSILNICILLGNLELFLIKKIDWRKND